MADQLQPQDGPAMTATEVHARIQLIRQRLGPIYGRLQSEYLQPLIERCFGIAYRAGALGAAPRSLAGRDFSVKYLGPLSRAQKLEDVTAIERLYLNIGQIAQARQDLSVYDNLDDDEAIRILGDALGAPNKIMRTRDDVTALRERRAEAEKQAAEQETNLVLQQTAGEAAIKKAAA